MRADRCLSQEFRSPAFPGAVIATSVAALAFGWRPSRRTAGVLLSAPLASASVVAFVFRNPFNGTILAAAAVTLVLLALQTGRAEVAHASPAASISGALMIAFGSFYPHFLVDRSPLAYLYGAPTGLIPCPTLSIVIGFSLLAGGLASRAVSLTVAALGFFYGVFGVVRLGVTLDIPLIAGALTLTLVAFRRASPGSLTKAVNAQPA